MTPVEWAGSWVHQHQPASFGPFRAITIVSARGSDFWEVPEIHGMGFAGHLTSLYFLYIQWDLRCTCKKIDISSLHIQILYTDTCILHYLSVIIYVYCVEMPQFYSESANLRSADFSHYQSAALDENLVAICWKTLQSTWKPSSIPHDVHDIMRLNYCSGPPHFFFLISCLPSDFPQIFKWSTDHCFFFFQAVLQPSDSACFLGMKDPWFEGFTHWKRCIFHLSFWNHTLSLQHGSEKMAVFGSRNFLSTEIYDSPYFRPFNFMAEMSHCTHVQEYKRFFVSSFAVFFGESQGWNIYPPVANHLSTRFLTHGLPRLAFIVIFVSVVLTSSLVSV